jgi:hypothetical protein
MPPIAIQALKLGAVAALMYIAEELLAQTGYDGPVLGAGFEHPGALPGAEAPHAA